ncbi:MAG: hypothetical protein ACRBCJ_09420 [Hyphomicrobiaceae bacterium]
MFRRIRIPFLIDVFRINSPHEIRSVSNDDQLDRDFKVKGPLFNQMLVRRLRKTLNVDGVPLPSIAPRHSQSRVDEQQQLMARLTPDSFEHYFNLPAFAALSDFVEGKQSRPAGELTQEFIGQLFSERYVADRETWAAAQLLDAAVRTKNPLRRLYWAITGKIKNAQQTLARAVNGDLSGVHATGVAVHTLLVSLERLETIYRDETLRSTLTPAAASARALVAPNSVLRQSNGGYLHNIGPLFDGTLVILNTRDGGYRSLDPRVMFLRDSWSSCPAHQLVPALLIELWKRAKKHSLADTESASKIEKDLKTPNKETDQNSTLPFVRTNEPAHG